MNDEWSQSSEEGSQNKKQQSKQEAKQEIKIETKQETKDKKTSESKYYRVADISSKADDKYQNYWFMKRQELQNSLQLHLGLQFKNGGFYIKVGSKEQVVVGNEEQI